MIKEFIRWYISSTEGRLNENGRPTVRTVQACAERFFGGFEELTKTKIIPDDRKEIKSVSLSSPPSETNPYSHSDFETVDQKDPDGGRHNSEPKEREAKLHKT